MINFLFYIPVFLTAYAGVKAFRHWSWRRKIFDVPNERSSHTVPTARGGGLIIVVISLTAYTLYTIFVTGGFQWSYLLGAALIAAISWLDDLYAVSFVWRFLIHTVAAGLIVFTLGYFREIYLPVLHTVNLGRFGAVITFLWIVWLTNAYNFMDGIDGIAGMQAVTAGAGWFLIGALGNTSAAGFYGGIIACASLGFLIQNWQPAKIFMGDVGSAFLGYSFGVLPLLAGNEKGNFADKQKFLPAAAVLLIWLFVFDTVFTFARRVFSGEKVWEAHRGHLYQKLVIGGFSHRTVASLYGVISILTIAATILWMYENDLWETILFALIALQSLGLVLYLFVFRNEKTKALI